MNRVFLSRFRYEGRRKDVHAAFFSLVEGPAPKEHVRDPTAEAALLRTCLPGLGCGSLQCPGDGCTDFSGVRQSPDVGPSLEREQALAGSAWPPSSLPSSCRAVAEGESQSLCAWVAGS